MKNSALLGVSFLLLVIIFIESCNTKDKSKLRSGQAFEKYVQAYTSGIISKTSTIQVVLTPDVVKQLSFNLDEAKGGTLQNPNEAGLFEFEPDIEGTTSWKDRQTLEFIPAKHLSANTPYKCTFKLGKLADMKKQFEEYVFDFHTKKQRAELKVDELVALDGDDFSWQQLNGSLITADYATTEEVGKLVMATAKGKSYPIKWESEPNGKMHFFSIDSIKRTEEAFDLTVQYDTKSMGSNIKGSKEVHIPSLNNFTLTGSRVFYSPKQYLQLQFSDPLDLNQNLKGLVRVEGISSPQLVVEKNMIKVFSNYRMSGQKKVTVREGIKNSMGYKLANTQEIFVQFDEMKPAVRFPKSGNVLPTINQGLVVPFEAVNLKAVDVKVSKVFTNNVKQFLQNNNIDGSYELKRVAKRIAKKTVFLNKTDVVDFGRWNRFSLDLNELIKTDPGAIYRISLSFKKSYSMYKCGDNEESELTDTDAVLEEDEEMGDDDEYYYYYDDDYWQNRDNPCHKAYYRQNRRVEKNIFATNLGLIAKKGNNQNLKVFVNDIRTTEPLPGCEIDIYDYQQQLLATATTSSDGIIDFTDMEEAFFVVAKKGEEKSYLKVNNGNALQVSRFDVSGTRINNGLKGFIYGERGVWRPGDSIFVSFILEEGNDNLPAGHPVIFELDNPSSQLMKRVVQKKNEDGVYSFKIKTSNADPTGNWSANILVGGAVFNKTLKIETIKPNRLKMNMDFLKKYYTPEEPIDAIMQVNWLHGAVAKDLEASLELVLRREKTSFEKYPGYQFDDETRYYDTEYFDFFTGNTDDKGQLFIDKEIFSNYGAPGKLRANFITKVYEKGGNFSIDQFSVPFYPYSEFAGFKVEGLQKGQMLETDSTYNVSLAIVSPEGRPVMKKRRLSVELYKLSWRWWWETSYDNISNYINRTNVQPYKEERVWASGGRAKWDFKVSHSDWGRYLLLVRNKETNQVAAKTIYFDWPDGSYPGKDGQGGANMLFFTSNKDKYNTGEEVQLTIPSSEGGRALVSIENGSGVLQTYWVGTKAEKTEFSFNATAQMCPNIYVNVSLLQPHAQTENDLPVRLYGVIPVSVENPETHLEPVISMPNELEPEKEFAVSISEKNNKPMSYTLAIVDEGLLDLTKFRTPDPWAHFYAKEALGVRTWDFYDDVIGAYGARLERLLSIGGDAELMAGDENKKAQRFKPVVKFLGPFYLDKGTKTHKISLPMYVGSVKVMVVAGYNRAYGKAGKAVPVRKPLMLLATLPRVLGPKESVRLPVTVFAMKDNVKNVSLSVETNGLLEVVGPGTQKTVFKEPGDETLYFDMQVGEKTGIAKVDITAKCGEDDAKYSIELDIRNPNLPVTETSGKMLEVGESYDMPVVPVGLEGTNSAKVEFSSIPPLNLEKRIKYLIRYPHGCVEQVTSSVFPQLYLSNLMKLSDEEMEDIQRNVQHAIQKLMTYQMADGGFSYWPGGSYSSNWGTTYAGHFLFEAQKKGYTVPSGMLNNWKSYQKRQAQKHEDTYYYADLQQAYRLYALALSGAPQLSAMNRLREKNKLHNIAQWRLAAAYQLCGKTSVAEQLIEGLVIPEKEYVDMVYTYGSGLRDKALILETLGLLDKKKEAFDLLNVISAKLSSDDWLSTQTTAFALISISEFVKKNMSSEALQCTYSLDNAQEENVRAEMPVFSQKLDVKQSGQGQLKVTNTGDGVMYVRLIQEGVPAMGDEEDFESHLKMFVDYKLMDGKKLNPIRIAQGTDFMAVVTLQNPGSKGDYNQMALSQLFPSGWEIMNTRMLDYGSIGQGSAAEYQDIRDDRVYTYFDLNKGATKTFKILLNASYVGKYYLPVTYCEAMYDATINARKHGGWVEVVEQ